MAKHLRLREQEGAAGYRKVESEDQTTYFREEVARQGAVGGKARARYFTTLSAKRDQTAETSEVRKQE